MGSGRLADAGHLRLMEIDLQQLRSLYRRMPDEGLLDAFTQGRESYLPQAWDIITQELASRGLPAPLALVVA